MEFLQAGGHRLEYTWIDPRPDAAPTLVFLHEGLGSVGMWRDFPARLAAATGCGALVYSRAGYGGSDPVELPRPVRFMHREAEVLTEVFDATGVERAIVFGHSDGASIALIHAGNEPGRRVQGLVLEAPHVFVEEVTVRSIAEIAEVYRTTDLAARLARYHGNNTDIAFRGWNDVWLDPEFRDWNIEEFLPRIRVPMLVIQGQDDQYGTLRQVAAIRAQTGGPAEVQILADCGHSPHRDQPEHTLQLAATFVAGQLARLRNGSGVDLPEAPE